MYIVSYCVSIILYSAIWYTISCMIFCLIRYLSLLYLLYHILCSYCIVLYYVSIHDHFITHYSTYITLQLQHYMHSILVITWHYYFNMIDHQSSLRISQSTAVWKETILLACQLPWQPLGFVPKNKEERGWGSMGRAGKDLDKWGLVAPSHDHSGYLNPLWSEDSCSFPLHIDLVDPILPFYLGHPTLPGGTEHRWKHTQREACWNPRSGVEDWPGKVQDWSMSRSLYKDQGLGFNTIQFSVVGQLDLDLCTMTGRPLEGHWGVLFDGSAWPTNSLPTISLSYL